ncbi:SIR2 family NAD-dependent protein deacylase [Halorubrum sp. FL23]|uniref:SIR2 family NAD-dependent protein deacylase n=1 Tax=Halorubrum sp. FL23 TaxID=3458704 RepID=UPI004034B341
MNIRKHLEQFSASIRGDERPVGMLLGAGCAKSVWVDGSPLIPDMRGMTTAVEERIRDEGYSESWERIHTIGEFDEENANIEDILNLVRELRPHAGREEIRGLTAEELEYLEDSICSKIIELVDKELPDTESGYHSLAAWMSSIERKEPVEVFTTNYDLLLEQAFEEQNVPFFDGFVGGHRPFFDSYSVLNDELPSRWNRLWKIHGSVNWASEKSDSSIEIWRSLNEGEDAAVIHPSHMKYSQSRKMPYLAYLDRLKQFLNKPEAVLFVVGYSFRDQHLNETIIDGLRGPPSAQVFAFLYSELKSYSNAQEIAKQNADLSVFAKDAGIIGTQKQEWESSESDSDPGSDTIGLDWEEVESNQWQQQFQLGDFEEFGNFLGSVIGR